MRTYPHRPDVAHLTKNARFTYGGVEKLQARIERSGPQVWDRMGLIALTTGWQAVALAWAEERPLPEVRGYLDLTADWCRHLMDAQPEGLDVLHAPGWLWTFVIAGDRDAALRLASRIPRDLRVDIAGNAPIADETTVVARLVDRTDPWPALGVLRGRLADPRVDGELAERLGPELLTAEAVAAHDAAAVERGYGELTRRHVEHYGTAAPGRRSVDGLLDLTGLMFAALAAERGLPVPVDNPYLPTALLTVG